MAQFFTVNVLERCQVSPPTAAAESLPLTFLDIPWLLFLPGQSIFFYEYPYSFTHFKSITLPQLKHSLSLTLHHFFPLAGSLILPHDETMKPKFIISKGDSVWFTTAETNADFNHLSSYYPRDAKQFHSLVPNLPSVDGNTVPLLAVQVTFFIKGGISIGLAYHHVAADGRTFHNFMKTWASFCSTHGKDSFLMNSSMPSYDRSVIIDSKGLMEIFLKQWWNKKSSEDSYGPVGKIGNESKSRSFSAMVRATFVVSGTDMERIKKCIISQCNKKNQPYPVHLSPYVLTCGLVWVCLLKCEVKLHEPVRSADLKYFGFNAGGMTRLGFSIPTNYYGSCVGFGRCKATCGDLLGEDGLLVAARVIGDTIKRLDESLLVNAENWISDWEVFLGADQPHLLVVGSPKVDLYGVDFGWGKPKKIEEISIDCRNAISLIKSRDIEGGIEVGLALLKDQMHAFSTLYTQWFKGFH